MFDNIKIDFNLISSYLWVVAIATIFSIFSIKYNPDFIYFGFVTFAYGIIGHVVFRTFDGIEINGNKKIWIRIMLEIATLSAWLYFIIKLI